MSISEDKIKGIGWQDSFVEKEDKVVGGRVGGGSMRTVKWVCEMVSVRRADLSGRWPSVRTK